MSRPKKIFLIAALAILLSAQATNVLALEIRYPTIPGIESPDEFLPKIESGVYAKEQILALYIRYIYGLFLILAGALIFGSLLYGGLSYLTSGGNPGKLAVAKDQMITAFTGIIILFSASILLRIINPNLLIMGAPEITRPVSIPITFPETSGETQVFWELPIGKLEERTLIAMQATKAPALILNNRASQVKNLANDLRDKLHTCDCTNTGMESYCSLAGGCGVPPSVCQGTPELLCPNSAYIAAKKGDLLTALASLQSAKNGVISVTVSLFRETSRLELTESFLKSCVAGAIDYYAFQDVRNNETIEVKRVWTDINTDDNHLAFYCQLEEGLVKGQIADWMLNLSNVYRIIAEAPSGGGGGGGDPIVGGPLPPIPDPVPGCFNIKNLTVEQQTQWQLAGVDWESNPTALAWETAALNTLADSQTFTSFACSAGDINIYLAHDDNWGGWNPSVGEIIIYDKWGVFSERRTLYIAAHEIGHTMLNRNGGMLAGFISLANASGSREPFFPYPSTYAYPQNEVEDACESIGVYPVGSIEGANINDPQMAGHKRFAEYIFLGQTP